MMSKFCHSLRRKWLVVALAVVGLSFDWSAAYGQGRGAQRPERQGLPPAGDQPVTPGEIQQMFDAYVLMQAQDVLKLNESQYPQFLTRLRALQTVRRRAENQRLMIINQLRRMLNATDERVDENSIKDRLKMLSDLNVNVAAEVRQAQESLDEILELRQQARFRVFEEEMERRKVELLMRTRARPQPNRPREF